MQLVWLGVAATGAIILVGGLLQLKKRTEKTVQKRVIALLKIIFVFLVCGRLCYA